MNLDLVDGHFILTGPTTMRDLVKQIPGMRAQGSGKWSCPANWTAAVVMNAVLSPHGLTSTPAVAEWAQRETTNNAAIEAGKVSDMSDADKLPSVGGLRLFPKQDLDSMILSATRSGLLAYEMRAGKCPTIIATLKRMARDDLNSILPILIVAPKGVRWTWKEEFDKWWPELGAVSVVGGTAAQRQKELAKESFVSIVSYETAVAHSRIAGYGTKRLTDEDRRSKELNNRFRTVILDEAHKIKDPSAKRTRAVWALGDEATYRFALTGTPVANNPMDLWSILRFLYPQEFPSRVQFTERYGNLVPNVFGGVECVGIRPDREMEFRSILDPKYIRRLRSEVLPKDIEHRFVTHYTEMADKQRKAYREMERSMLTQVDGSILAAPDPLSQFIRLHQIAAATPVIEDGKVTALDMPSCKVEELLEILEDDEEPALVFMQSRKLLDLCARQLTKEGISFVSFKGGQSDKVRENGRHEFQAGKHKVALCQIDSASEGITLNRASRIIYLQRSYSLTSSVQSESRADGVGQMRDYVDIIDVITKDTAEEKLHRSVLNKETNLRTLMRDKGYVQRLLSA